MPKEQESKIQDWTCLAINGGFFIGNEMSGEQEKATFPVRAKHVESQRCCLNFSQSKENLRCCVRTSLD